MRLEKLVKMLEDQQDRAQAQRTRLEHRIAQLEVSLREKNKSDSNRYVMRKYLRTPRSDTIDSKLSRALSCDSRRALLEAPASTFHLVDSHSRERSGFSRYQPVSPAKSTDYPLRKFNVNDWCRVSSDKEKVFTCEQCRREINGKFRDGMIRRHVKEHHVPIRRSLYGWLMDCTAVEAFGEPTNSLNKIYNGRSSSEEDADCFFRIVDPFVVRDRNKKSRRRRERYCRFSKRSFQDASPRRCNPIIRTT